MPRTTKPKSASKPRREQKDVGMPFFQQTEPDIPDGFLPEDEERELKEYITASGATPKEILFVEIYTGTYKGKGPNRSIKPWNARKAGLAAGYPEKSIDNIIFKVKNKPKIKNMITERLADQVMAARITANKTASHYAAIAYSDPASFYNSNGSLKQLDELELEQRLAISAIEMDTVFDNKDTPHNVITKIKLWDKAKGLEYCKNVCREAGVGLLPESDTVVKHVHEGPDGKPISVNIEGLDPIKVAQLYRDMVLADKLIK